MIKLENDLKDLTALINTYLYYAKEFCNVLKEAYDLDVSLPRAKVQKLIPKRGSIKGLYFNFHGKGCFFAKGEVSIDIDFGPNGRMDGFDSFRLKQFLKSNKGQVKDIENELEFDRQFNALIERGIICKHPDFPDDSLYYFTPAGGSQQLRLASS